MPFPSIPGPATLIGVAGKGVGAVEQAIGLMPRMLDLVTAAEGVLSRVDALVERIESTRQRADAVVDRTGTVVELATVVVEHSSAVVEQTRAVLASTEALTDRLDATLTTYEPVLTSLHPTLERLADTTDPDEVAAIVAMLDLLPDLVIAMRDDVIPILDTFGTVAPDLRDLLDTSRELNDMIATMPGLGRVKRRIEKRQYDEDSYRAAGEPPAEPHTD